MNPFIKSMLPVLAALVVWHFAKRYIPGME